MAWIGSAPLVGHHWSTLRKGYVHKAGRKYVRAFRCSVHMQGTTLTVRKFERLAVEVKFLAGVSDISVTP